MKLSWLETKRTSITRLKHTANAGVAVTLGGTWNQKNLDYEIETAGALLVLDRCTSLKPKEPRLRDWNLCVKRVKNTVFTLETKRTSITRLKLILSNSCGSSIAFFLKPKEPRLRDWNPNKHLPWYAPRFTWNQKNLDYEIETRTEREVDDVIFYLETKRTSITRLKQDGKRLNNTAHELLKPKEPRLRDWNFTAKRKGQLLILLETKRTSITRLKRD